MYNLLFLAMKRCPIAAKIVGSIGILPRCVLLNDFFTTFARFVRPFLATIICVLEIWSGSNNRVYMYHVFHLLANEKKIIKKKKINKQI